MSRLTRSCRWIGTHLAAAPVSCVWLVILFITTVLQHSMSPQHLDRVLGHHSTNITNLGNDPFQVLVSSLFWLDGAYWLPYLISFCIFVIPTERWLGSPRFIVVGFSAHVIATYVSEGILRWAIDNGLRSPLLTDTHDVGVSYFLAAVAAVLAYHFVRPWRWVYLVGTLAFYLLPLVTDLTFTAIGHACSALIGLAWYPITRGRAGKPWDPMVPARAVRARFTA
ncbi:rhomboid-like protein [Gordonia sp. DT30]|uniref:rhomboid-like protein n=1 Tax=Gordonia sp. DT30 TaxID=3416546 RepID=UPI003CFAA390